MADTPNTELPEGEVPDPNAGRSNKNDAWIEAYAEAKERQLQEEVEFAKDLLHSESNRADALVRINGEQSAKLQQSVPKRALLAVSIAAFLLGAFILWAVMPDQEEEMASLTSEIASLKEVAKKGETINGKLGVCLADLKKAEGKLVTQPSATESDASSEQMVSSDGVSSILQKIEDRCVAKPVVATKSRSAGAQRQKTKRQSAPAAPTHQVSSGQILLWHVHDASPTNPKPCVISRGNGIGLPSYCSGFTVNAVKNGESKSTWLVRVGGGNRPTDTGMYTKVSESRGPVLPGSGIYQNFNN